LTGVRFGTAEIYAVLDHFPDIEESIAVGQKLAGGEDEQVLLFIKLHSNKKLAESLLESIRVAIRKSLSPRHVPAHILQVKDVPYTINGKKMELLVRDIVSGKSPKVVGTAANPECLKEYSQFYLLANRDTPKSKL
jgi:acetoacetyl-CoA synthetase